MSILFGPLLGGAFATYGNWRGAFYAVAALACVLAAVAVRALPRTLTGGGERPRVPALRVTLMVLRSSPCRRRRRRRWRWSRPSSSSASIAGLALMLALDRRAAAPLLPRDAFPCAR
jgi:MFS family permease